MMSPLAVVANAATRATTAHDVNMVATEWPRRCARAAGGPAPSHHTISRSAPNAPRWLWLWRAVVVVVVAARLYNNFVCLLAFVINKIADRIRNHRYRRARHSEWDVRLTFTWRSRLCWRLAAGVSDSEAGSDTVTDNMQYLRTSRLERENHSHNRRQGIKDIIIHLEVISNIIFSHYYPAIKGFYTNNLHFWLKLTFWILCGYYIWSFFFAYCDPILFIPTQVITLFLCLIYFVKLCYEHKIIMKNVNFTFSN